ncbi:MAG TPA: hypothetical protein DD490_24790 [Acidobacteria bacterium]|nr:hypothetical protein [Acidobacteriota bacterium]
MNLLLTGAFRNLPGQGFNLSLDLESFLLGSFRGFLGYPSSFGERLLKFRGLSLMPGDIGGYFLLCEGFG